MSVDRAARIRSKMSRLEDRLAYLVDQPYCDEQIMKEIREATAEYNRLSDLLESIS